MKKKTKTKRSKSTTGKSGKKKSASRKSSAKKSAARKSGTKKTTAKKTGGKKTGKTKTTGKKTAPKKSTLKKAGAPQVRGGKSTLTFLTESLAGYFVGQFYSAQVEASGGTLPYSFGITEGALPPGLSFNSRGVLAGTPTQDIGDTTIFVQVIDFVEDRLTQAYDLMVLDA